PDELARISDLTERLAARMKYRLTRRERQRRRGRRLDLRRVIHQSIRFGGTPMRLAYRMRWPKPLRLVVILDASGSMSLYSTFFVRFIRGVLDHFREAEAFVFHTRLIHISAALRERDTEKALERMALMAAGWAGGVHGRSDAAGAGGRAADPSGASGRCRRALADGAGGAAHGGPADRGAAAAARGGDGDRNRRQLRGG
ncbi:MAG: VWA domain-containing protein, partial [Rhodobacteraceae bacterium]|nr:VWA domain-containing protein [Paracoccaceae bacterium]